MGGERSRAACGCWRAPPASVYTYQPGPAWHYRERLGFRDQLTIVGGGHVSLALVAGAGAARV
ncbi:MAG: hypothetical protein WKG07_09560 [Hymenobacter sp.]